MPEKNDLLEKLLVTMISVTIAEGVKISPVMTLWVALLVIVIIVAYRPKWLIAEPVGPYLGGMPLRR